MSKYNNVLFLGAARLPGNAVILASYSYNAETDLGAVRQVLEQPNTRLQPGSHYTFNVGQLAWHLISDDTGIIYILICVAGYPQRCAHLCLEELQQAFVAKVGEKALTAKERSLDKQCGGFMQSLCQKFDNVGEVDKIAALSKKVDTVKIVMQENVDAALQNCVKLESIEMAAEELQQQAGVFRKNAKDLKDKMWWKDMKMKIIIAAIVLTILGVIIGIAVAMSKSR